MSQPDDHREGDVEVVPTPVDATPTSPSAGSEAVGEVEYATEDSADEPAEEVMVSAPGLPVKPALEAVLLVVDEPVTELTLAQIVEHPTEEVATALAELSAEYTDQGRGFDLRRAAGGWRLYTREDYAPYVERFVSDGQQARLTQASLETLAVVAYKQPVTRSKISAIRGVGVDSVMRTLVARGLVEESGEEPETGAHLYVTTPLFLEKLGLNSLAELPPLAPLLPDMADLDEVLGADSATA